MTCSNVSTWATASARLQDEFFGYRSDGSLKTITDSTAAVTTYNYGSSPVAHAPHRIAGGDQFTYDANGNQTVGLDGKVMAYDGENRPLSVSMTNGDTTTYIYGAEGKRLERIETVGSTATTALYLGDSVEIIKPTLPSEKVHWYLPGNIRQTFGDRFSQIHVMHRDQLSSTVMVTDENADWGIERAYAPFGADTEWVQSLTVLPEDIGFIGERKDAVSGLHYLNARYYDPKLRMFIQPDWFEVTKAGVGTNRYAYSFNDPVNLSDSGGNHPAVGLAGILGRIGSTIAGFFGGATTAEVGITAGVAGTAAAVGVISNQADDTSVFSKPGDSTDDGGSETSDESSTESSEVSDDDPDPDDDDEQAAKLARDAKRMSAKALEKAARNNGYRDAHDLKDDFGLGGSTDVFSDRYGNLYGGNLDGSGNRESLGINKDGS